MKKLLITWLVFWGMHSFCNNAEAKLRVVSTLPIFDGLVAKISGDRVDHKSLASGGQDPHFVDAKPSFVSELARADVLVDGGLGLEDGWLPDLVHQSANPKIQSGAVGRINLSRGLKILETSSSADRSQGDVHPQGNPHVWLDPRNVLIMTSTIAGKLSALDPDGKATYTANLKSFQLSLKTAITRWTAALKPYAGTPIVSYHKSFAYFSAFSGLRILDTIESLPGIPPSSSRLVNLAALIKNGKVRVILGETWYPIKDGKFLSENTGVPFHVLAECGVDYIACYDKIVSVIASP